MEKTVRIEFEVSPGRRSDDAGRLAFKAWEIALDGTRTKVLAAGFGYLYEARAAFQNVVFDAYSEVPDAT